MAGEPETKVDELLEAHDRFDKGIVLGIVAAVIHSQLFRHAQMRANSHTRVGGPLRC